MTLRWLLVVGFSGGTLIIPACGGKVVLDAGATGSGGAGNSAHASSSTASGATSGTAMCLTTVTVGGGPLGPSLVHGTKCFAAPSGGNCPPASAAAKFITPDGCYQVKSVDDQCTAAMTGTCCYDTTEELMCDG